MCEHTDRARNPAPATCLDVSFAQPENQGRIISNRRSSIYCEECGTYWRVWPDLHIAKYYITSTCQRTSLTSCLNGFPYRRSVLRDIDTIIDAVSQMYPAAEVTQWQYVWPGDDDGLWWFSLPGDAVNSIQIESYSGMCPFLVETDDPCCENARTATTVEEATLLITEHFARLTP